MGAKRYQEHLYEARKHKGHNPHKEAIIRKLLKAGLKPTMDVIFTTPDEQKAFDFEIATIAALKQQNIPLVNLTKGGEGHSGHYPSQATRIKLSKAQQNIGIKAVTAHLDSPSGHLEPVKTYKSAAEAARQLKISRAQISRCVNPKYHHHTAGGFQ